MKIKQLFSRAVLVAVMLIPFLSFNAKAIALSQENEIEGVIVTRDVDNFAMRSDAGNITNFTLSKSTKIEMVKGLVGIRSDEVSATVLVPGLRVSLEPESESVGKDITVAKSIQFHGNDLLTANEIQGALTLPQHQIKILIEQAQQQEQKIAAMQKQLSAQDQLIAEVKADTDKRFNDTDKRFNDLADYDLKEELTILFDVNSASLSDKAKGELKAIAAKAKTIKGYFVQVAGFADSAGSASINQNLSDRRADAVANFLRQSGDLGPSRVLATVAMSSSKPVASNETAQGKAENRRVTVKVVVNRGIAQ